METAPSTEGLRVDIQGLRAIAVALVVAYHLAPGVVRGGYIGVDVFFVISGFLITGHLLRSAPRTAGDVVGFWVRRIRRLLPAALLVLTTTLVAVRLIGPITIWGRTAKESGASALYIANWLLARVSTDYLSGSTPPTAAQHYWSLSVEEQFYLVWPIVILAAAAIGRRARGRSRSAVPVVVAVVGLASFAECVRLTSSNADAAYFRDHDPDLGARSGRTARVGRRESVLPSRSRRGRGRSPPGSGWRGSRWQR